MADTANPNCYYEIEQALTEDVKNNTLVKTVFYV
jgi:hypothetical protein